jgi:WbqC-like protein family
MTGKRIAILQSNYVPWKGYFDLIASVDEFVLYDDRQYTVRDWRNRNRIKTSQGLQWLTIPVTGGRNQRIDEVQVESAAWASRHWTRISQAYRRAPHFDEFRDRLSDAYDACADEPLLHRINRRLLDEICRMLGVTTEMTPASSYRAEGSKSERLVAICRAAGASSYLSGPAARSYLDESLFESAGIPVEWMDYSGYPEYRQLYPPFVHEVSVLDLLFNTGDDASRYMKAVPRAA